MCSVLLGSTTNRGSGAVAGGGVISGNTSKFPIQLQGLGIQLEIGGSDASNGEDNSDFLYRESVSYSNSILLPQTPPTKPTLVE
jgi:hypothetical protein